MMQVFRWFSRRRNELRSGTPSDTALVKIAALVNNILDAACFLLLVQNPPSTQSRPLLDVPCGAITAESSGSRKVHPAMKRALLVVRAVARWRCFHKQIQALKQESLPPPSEISTEIITFIQSVSDQWPQIPKTTMRPASVGTMYDPRSGINLCKRKVPFRLGPLIQIIADNHRRAVAREAGLKKFKAFLEHTKLPSLAFDLLSALPPAIRNSTGKALVLYDPHLFPLPFGIFFKSFLGAKQFLN